MKSSLTIAISSGKGGTGKTFVSTNLAVVFSQLGREIRYLDCDVEEPNAHLFLKPEIEKKEDITVLSPSGVDAQRCTACGKCAEVCRFHAVTKIKDSILFFPNLCHICGACSLVCPHEAITYSSRKIGEVIHGKTENMELSYGLLETGEGGMTPRLIREVKKHYGNDITILDSPPGTSCPVVETVKDADLCVMITDPTPFGIHDLKLAVAMCRDLGKEPVVIVNRATEGDVSVKEVCAEENLKIIGEIPDERKIAECYSEGEIAVLKFPELRELFCSIAVKIQALARQKTASVVRGNAGRPDSFRAQEVVFYDELKSGSSGLVPQIVVISGKGGTGKTSLAAAFCALEKNISIADCDVDASDLHLLLQPEVHLEGAFSGGMRAEIDAARCSRCGKCYEACRFDAVKKIETEKSFFYRIDPVGCEGCGVCTLVCREKAVRFNAAVNGLWFDAHTRFGPMSHARLFPGEENSGKLVSLLKNRAQVYAEQNNSRQICIDGSPGIGCPVIASLNNTQYAVIVTEPTVSGIHDLKRILDVIVFFKIKAGVIVNKSDINPGKTQEIEIYVNENKFDFLGEIPYDKAVTEAQKKGVTIVEYTDTKVSASIKEIWKKVNNTINK
ncbi:MAG: ATP-binding protein [Spirochaetales bacterium]|nr:ATP-binding protein [Spirochaetales bacterium]